MILVSVMCILVMLVMPALVILSSILTRKRRYRNLMGMIDKEFALMSKGLGAGYLTPNMIKWHTRGNIENKVYLPLKDGKKAAMPRYYKDKLYDKGQKFRIGVFMRAESQKQVDELQNKYGDLYWYKHAEETANDFRRMAKKAQTRQKPFKKQTLKARL